MVRFKNRHILVEFLSPSLLHSTVANASAPPSLSPNDINGSQNDDGDQVDDDDDDALPLLPVIPFLVPSADANERLKLGDESGSVIYKAIKQTLLDLFGDEGWGRVSSSFKVIYHSPLTTLTILRISRSHYRTLWAALTLTRDIAAQPVLPRVLALSGTIKKLQNRAVAYHRLVTAQMLAVVLERMAKLDRSGIESKEEETRLRRVWEKEVEAMSVTQD